MIRDSEGGGLECDASKEEDGAQGRRRRLHWPRPCRALATKQDMLRIQIFLVQQHVHAQ
jgi:hypothetical protein